MESMTDWAFSWPISTSRGVSASVLMGVARMGGGGLNDVVVRAGRARGWEEGSTRTLVVVDDVSEMVLSAVMSLSHAHRVVRQVDIAVVACFAARSARVSAGVETGVSEGAYRRLHGKLAMNYPALWEEISLHFGILAVVAGSISRMASTCRDNVEVASRKAAPKSAGEAERPT